MDYVDIYYTNGHMRLYLTAYFPCGMKRFHKLMRIVNRRDFGYNNNLMLMRRVGMRLADIIQDCEQEMDNISYQLMQKDKMMDVYRSVVDYGVRPSGIRASEIEVIRARQELRVKNAIRNDLQRSYKRYKIIREKSIKQLHIVKKWLNENER